MLIKSHEHYKAVSCTAIYHYWLDYSYTKIFNSWWTKKNASRTFAKDHINYFTSTLEINYLSIKPSPSVSKQLNICFIARWGSFKSNSLSDSEISTSWLLPNSATGWGAVFILLESSWAKEWMKIMKMLHLCAVHSLQDC